MTERQIVQSTRIKRTSVPALDTILGWQFPVLDHGFVRVIDYMGDDIAIDEAARTSYGDGTTRVNAAKGLINTLMRDRHTSPFEMCELKLHIKLPIFVMRQWVRHRMASLNEYSARYSVMKDEFYLPRLEALMRQSKDNKQGRAGAIEPVMGKNILTMMDEHNINSYGLYEALLEDDVDLTRELARINLPVSAYTEVYWKIDLHNLFHFLMLRNDPHAQMEIRVYAELIQSLVESWVPLATAAFINYRQTAISFSGAEQSLLPWALSKQKLFAEDPAPEGSSLSKREWASFVSKVEKIKNGT